MTIRELMTRAHATATEKGWWDQRRNVGEAIALMHSELSEALEEYRAGRPLGENRVEDGKPEGFTVELADLLIRVADLAQGFELPLVEALETKLAYNRTRPHRHGGKIA